MKKYNQNKFILLCNLLISAIIAVLIIMLISKNINSSISKAANNTFTLNPPNSDNSNDYNVYKIQENTPKPSNNNNTQNQQDKNKNSNTNKSDIDNSNKTSGSINKSDNNSKSISSVNKSGSNSKSSSSVSNSKSNDNTTKLYETSNENIRVNNSIKITKLELSSHFVKLTAKKSISVSAIIIPSEASSKNLIWESLDNDIAFVKNGKITGIKKGFTTIFVSTKNEKIKAACSVKIE